MSEENNQNENQPTRFSQEQYDLLKKCSDKKDMAEWNEWREKNEYEDILLEGAALGECYLKDVHLNCSGVDFLNDDDTVDTSRKGKSDVYLRGANLGWAHLEGASLMGCHLEKSTLKFAHLEGADLADAHLEGADLFSAHLEGAYLWELKVNRYNKDCRFTDFSGVGLDSIRIDPATKQLLKYNIRRMNWEDWYKEHSKLKWGFKTFWWMSDYGLSEKRIVKVFLSLVFIFSIIYYLWGLISPTGIIDNLFVDRNGVQVPCWIVPLRALYFSIITMTLGFSDMYAKAQSIWGHILIALQAILGYLLLGALVTRFAIMFTAGGPAGKFSDEKKKENTDNKDDKVS